MTREQHQSDRRPLGPGATGSSAFLTGFISSALEDWLRGCRLTPADLGPNLGVKWPYGVRRYLRRDVNGRPRKDWRPPRFDIQLKIERLTRGGVTPADWTQEVSRRSLTIPQGGSRAWAGHPRTSRQGRTMDQG